MIHWVLSFFVQTQHSRGVLRKRCSENVSKFAGELPCQSVISIKLHEIILRHGCAPVNLFIFSEYIFLKASLEGCFCILLVSLILWSVFIVNKKTKQANLSKGKYLWNLIFKCFSNLAMQPFETNRWLIFGPTCFNTLAF